MGAFTYSMVEGRFAKIHAGVRLRESSHSFAECATGYISENPKDHTRWLKLADRLEEESNLAHIMIRLLFDPMYKVPFEFTGYMQRSFRYYESGQMYWDSVGLDYTPDRNPDDMPFTAMFPRQGPKTREEAVKIITQEGTSNGRFCNLVIMGHTPPKSAVLLPGKVVRVAFQTPTGKVIKSHTTRDTISVPLNAEWVYDKGNDGMTIEFRHDDYTVWAKRDDVILQA